MNIRIQSWLHRNFAGQEPWPCHNVIGVGPAHDLIYMALDDAKTSRRIACVGFYQSLPDFPVYGEKTTGRGVRVEFSDDEVAYQAFIAVLRSHAALFDANIIEIDR